MQEYLVFLSNHWMLSLAFVALAAMLIWSFIAPSVRGYSELKPADAVRLVNDDDALVLDVRTENEFHQGHIARAINLPLQVLNARMAELEGHKNKPVLVVCQSGNRSSQACAQLRRQGFTQVSNLAGGVMAWQHANFPLNKKKK